MKHEHTIATALGCSLAALVIGLLLGFSWTLKSLQSQPNATTINTTCNAFWADGTCYESRSRATFSVEQDTTGTINLYPNALYTIEIYSNPTQ